MIYSRKEFADYFNNKRDELGADNSPLWAAEEGSICQWFIKVRPLSFHKSSAAKSNFWFWCVTHLAGNVVCYSSDDYNEEEWWGFTVETDIVLWVLKWG